MRGLLLVLAILLAACAGPSREPTTTRPASAPFKASAVRQPAVFVRVEIGSGQFSERQLESMPGEYEGTLLEALNARAVPAKDVRLLSSRERLDPKAAVARAREIGADHALLVEARVVQGETVFCREGRRPFRTTTTVWSQRLVVLRASDGAVAFETMNPVEVAAIDPDCEAPRESRRRSAAEHMSSAVEALLARLLGS